MADLARVPQDLRKVVEGMLAGRSTAPRETLTALAPRGTTDPASLGCALSIQTAAANGRLLRLQELGLAERLPDAGPKGAGKCVVRYGITELGRRTAALPAEAFTITPRPAPKPPKPPERRACPVCKEDLTGTNKRTCGRPECERKLREFLGPVPHPEQEPVDNVPNFGDDAEPRDVPDRILTHSGNRRPHR